MNTRLLMNLSAAFLAILGVGITFLPQELLAHVGVRPDGSPVLLMQMLGALYLGFAILNWMYRGNRIGGIYGRPVSMANFLNFAVGAVALVKGSVAQRFEKKMAICRPAFFASAQDLRNWFDQNGAKASELIVGFFKTHTGRAVLTWPLAVDELEAEGRMTEAGLAAFALRTEARSRRASYEQEQFPELSAAETRQFKKNKVAWAFYETLPSGHRRTVNWRIINAKQQVTRAKRFQALIAACAEGRRT